MAFHHSLRESITRSMKVYPILVSKDFPNMRSVHSWDSHHALCSAAPAATGSETGHATCPLKVPCAGKSVYLFSRTCLGRYSPRTATAAPTRSPHSNLVRFKSICGLMISGARSLSSARSFNSREGRRPLGIKATSCTASPRSTASSCCCPWPHASVAPAADPVQSRHQSQVATGGPHLSAHSRQAYGVF